MNSVTANYMRVKLEATAWECNFVSIDVSKLTWNKWM